MNHAVRSRILPVAWLTLIISAAVVAAGCHTVRVANGTLGEWEQPFFAFFESESGTAGPYLTTELDAGSGDVYDTGAALQSGAAMVAAAANGAPTPQKVKFDLSQPLEQTLWLNLSKPIQGVLWWKSDVSERGGKESGSFRIDVFAGTKRIGGDAFKWTVYQSAGNWVPFYFKFRSELRQLDAGDVLSVQVTREYSLANFKIGTGGAYQSFIELRYLTFDPLSRAAYVENGRVVFIETAEGESSGSAADRAEAFAATRAFQEGGSFVYYLPAPVDEGSEAEEAAAAAAAASLPAIGLFALAGDRRRRATVLLAGLLLMAALAGCSSKESSTAAATTETSGPRISQTHVTNETLRDQGVGAIEGVIADVVGVPIKAAHVSVLGTNLFTKSAGDGKFRFDNVTARKYVIRVEAERYEVLEKPIEVFVGKITQLDIRLHKPGSMPHVHGVWPDNGEITLFSSEVTPCSTAGTVDCPTPGTGSEWRCSGINTGDHTGTTVPACETKVPIDVYKPVPAGAGSIIVTLDWASGAKAPKEMGLRIVTNGNSTVQTFAFRAPKDPFRIEFFPNEADPGHQKFTQWSFWMRIPEADAYLPAGPVYYEGGKVRVTITAVKAIVPFEPSHRDFWQGQAELPVITGKKLSFTASLNGYPRDETIYRWLPDAGVFVPPGTKEIRGTLKAEAVDSLAPETWSIAYRPGNMPVALWDNYNPPKAEMGPVSGATRTVLIPLKAEETDQFYQFRSNWAFFIDDDYKPPDRALQNYALHYQGKWTFTLELVAVRDPSWQDTDMA